MADSESAFIFIYVFIYMCVPVGVCTHEHSGHAGQKRTLDLPELELQVVVST